MTHTRNGVILTIMLYLHAGMVCHYARSSVASSDQAGTRNAPYAFVVPLPFRQSHYRHHFPLITLQLYYSLSPTPRLSRLHRPDNLISSLLSKVSASSYSGKFSTRSSHL